MATNREKKSLAYHITLQKEKRKELMKRRREACRHDREGHRTRINADHCLICDFCEMILHDPWNY